MKSLLASFFIFSSIIATAQTKIGLQGGLLLSHINVNEKDINDLFFSNPKNITGFKVGILAEFHLSNNFYLTSELNLVRKGGKINNTLTDGNQLIAYRLKSITNNIELPINLNYKLKVGCGSILAGVGPVVEYLVSEKNIESVASSVPQPTHELNPDKNGSISARRILNLKHFNWGANFIAGYEFPFGLRATIQARPDFYNRDEEKSKTYKNFYWGLSFGYIF